MAYISDYDLKTLRERVATLETQLEQECKARKEMDTRWQEQFNRAEAAERRLAEVDRALKDCDDDYNYLLTLTADKEGLHAWLRARLKQIRALAPAVEREQHKEQT